MADPTAEQNLLFGVLALQLSFIRQDDFLAAVRAWTQDRTLCFAPLLCEQHALRAEDANLLAGLADSLIRHNGNDPARPLGELLPSAVVPALAELNDPDVRRCLSRIGKSPSGATVNFHAAPGDTPTVMTGPGQSGQVPAPSGGNSSNRYRIVRPHARGGLGEVFVAHDEELQREVALKEMQHQHLGKSDNRARFLLEGEITGRLEHPGIVPVYGLGLYPDGRPFYAMRLIRGESLRHAIHRVHGGNPVAPGERALELRKLLARFVDVCNAIEYAHSRGVLHRDIKPDNIMLGPYGETLVVDWGLAKEIGSQKSEDRDQKTQARNEEVPAPSATGSMMGQVLGTPQYMSPEQASGRIDLLGPASDVYSLGATLHHLLVGEPPFPADRDVHRTLRLVQSGGFIPPRQVNSAVPRALEAVCLKAMAVNLEERYQSAKELASDLERWLADEPVTAWREPWPTRLRRWGRRHRTTVVSGGVLCLTALVLVSVSYLLLANEQKRTEEAIDQRALAQVDALLDASPRAVPDLIKALDSFRDRVRSRLEQVRGRPETDSPRARLHRLRASLALLAQGDGDQLEFLRERLTDPELDPEECLLLCDQLADHAGTLTAGLWKEAEKPGVSAEKRFRVLAALARFDPKNPKWETYAGLAIAPLLQSDPLHVGIWTSAFAPVRQHLIVPLSEVFSDPEVPAERRVAANVLREYAEDDPGLLVRLIADANPAQAGLLLPRLQVHKEKAIPLLKEKLKEYEKTNGTEDDRDTQARRRANLAAILLHLGEPVPAWEVLRLTPYPDARTHLIHLLSALDADPGILVRQLLEKDTREDVRRALVLALGGYTPEQFSREARAKVLPRLLQWYRDDPDPGMHAALDWLLRQGREGKDERPLAWEQAPTLDAINAGLRGKRDEKKRWYVGPDGETMVVLGPAEFDMGSLPSEDGHESDETLHRRRIGRTFALAAHEVSVRQFRQFLAACPGSGHEIKLRYSPDEDCPVVFVTWFEAAMYCRWLSEQEKLPETQMCFPPLDDIRKASKGEKPLVLPANYLQRTGYRLPTEAEWEYACRAGSKTSRPHGVSNELLLHYAWDVRNALSRTWPVGQKKPNDFGLFDMFGNAAEWCLSLDGKYPESKPGQPAEDEETVSEITPESKCILRGAPFHPRPAPLRSAYRYWHKPTDHFSTIGFRIARTGR